MVFTSSKSFIVSKAKSMVSSLSSNILWSTGSTLLSTTSLENPKPYSSIKLREDVLGLKALICTEKAENTHCSHSPGVSKKTPKTTCPSVLSSSPFQHCPLHRSETMDDLIGTDSGVHMVPAGYDDYQTTGNREKRNNSWIVDKRRHYKATQHYPPPISSATDADRVILTRRHGEGKLVIEGRIEKHHEHLEARRENGRLILALVSTGSEDHGVESSVDEGFDHADEGLDANKGLESSGNALGCGVFMDTMLTFNASNNVSSCPAFVRPVIV